MARYLRRTAAAIALFFTLFGTQAGLAQKSGGVLKVYHRDSPGSMSILEEATLSTLLPMMGVFNNLVLYDQHVAQNSLATIVPDLATDWSWSEDGTQLTFHLRDGVTWHDGKPFTSADVRCTWELLAGRSTAGLRTNPRRSWYSNVREVTTGGGREVTFVLGRPQPALLALLASGLAPIYPCHIPARDMRSHPIGTGPFKFVEYKPNQGIRVERNPDYWKPGRPYLDGVEYGIIPNRSTAILALVAGKYDLSFPYDVAIPLLKDVQSQAPDIVCDLAPLNASRNVIVNRRVAPFDNPEARRAIALSLDRKSFIGILGEGVGDIGGTMLPPPAGLWGLPSERLEKLPGYSADIAKNRAEARGIMERLGYGPDNRLKIKVAARNIPISRDPAIILIDQLKSIYIDGDLDLVDTAAWFPKIARHDYVIGHNLTANAVDDPDQHLYENYACGSERNATAYCNPELERLFERQSVEADQEKRKQLVWDIDEKLQQDGARPIIFHYRAATCRQPYVRGLTIMVNSIYNGWRFEDVWLDR
jgi:peptide/nickel transport system substrate-binding protein